MFILRIAFPSAHRADKNCTFEWSFKGATSELTWEALISKLCEHTRTKKGKFYVSWHDGTEYCTISTNESLREAVNHMLVNRPDHTALIYVTPVVPAEEKRLGGFYGGCAPEELPRDFREYVDTDMRTEDTEYCNPTSYGPFKLVCNQCQRTDWHGDKFSCVLCPRFVLCGPCYRSGFHAQHPILITRECSGYPCPILQAVKVVAANIVSHDSDDDLETQNDSELQKARKLSLNRDSATSNSLKPIANPEPEDPKIAAAIQQLRTMGFAQDYNRLSRLAKEENGDVSNIIEKLVD